ncbi:hypothetical protein OIU85_006430 [Salix viminalis]|uniref:Trichome birefringence-like C-terminal domain-containing protein n=1 Tax=Salix viminalis TaxID=40686 RepID=A0A9Q0PLQ6_SALVM|nr:hypothetical protein OIU85_006430 [Salix viminalis]
MAVAYYNSQVNAMHYRALDWNNPNAAMCERETTPILNMSIPLEGSNDHRYFEIAEKVPSPEQKANPAKYSDCIHWCVPGLPDTWNELLYVYITNQY